MSRSPAPESLSLLRQALDLLIEAWEALWNGIFSLTRTAARIRLLILMGLLAVVISHLISSAPSSPDWTIPEKWFQEFVANARSPILVRLFFLVRMAVFPVWEYLTDPHILRGLLLWFFPFLFGLLVASIYQADIFEKDHRISRAFIWRAAFGRKYGTVRIRQGAVVEEDRESPIIQIGGPGFIQVELDSAVLTEKADSRPRVIGPTEDQKGKRAVLDGFERVRQGVDLRDQAMVPPRAHPDIVARSREGMRITVKDVRYVYSIYRGRQEQLPPGLAAPQTPLPLRPDVTPLTSSASTGLWSANITTTLRHLGSGRKRTAKPLPYPFDPEAVKGIVYGRTQTVSVDKPIEPTPDWLEVIPRPPVTMINIEYGSFIGANSPGEFITFQGEPDVSQLRQQQASLIDDAKRILAAGEPKAGTSDVILGAEIPSPGRIFDRTYITGLFDSDKFKETARKKGIQVRWVGVGTWAWDRQEDFIPSKHLEAWQLSRETRARSADKELAKRRNQSRLEELGSIVQRLLSDYDKIQQDHPAISREEIILKLLVIYLNLLQDSLDLCRPMPVTSDKELVNALDKLKQTLSHPIGPSDKD